jgi:hypothetical protein
MTAKKTYVLLTLSVLTLLFFSQPVWLEAGIIPAPEDILGFKVGADYHLITISRPMIISSNWPRLERIKLEQMGQTTLGLPMYYAINSSAENLARLQEYKDIIKKLSLGRRLFAGSLRQAAGAGHSLY